MRMSLNLTMLGVVFGLWLAAAPTEAHHAFTAEFDANKPVSLRGTVTKVEWINPHSWLHVDVKGDDGQVVNWAFELGAPNALFKRGWRKDSIQLGIEVEVTGFRGKSGRPIANGRTIKFTDGRELFAGSSGTGAPADGADSTERR
jgi:Family of unknown function (DUF6152)